MTITNTSVRSRQVQSKKGFTLTEIAIVLGIIGLILGAIWVAAAGVYANQRVSKANDSVLKIAQGIRTLYASSSTTGYVAATLITPVLVTAGVIPTDLQGGVGPFPNGTTGVIATSDGLGFVIAMSNVPRSSCINLLTIVGGTNRDGGLYMADAVNTALPVAGDATTIFSPATVTVTPNIANAAAVPAGGGGTVGGCTNAFNKIRLGFSLK